MGGVGRRIGTVVAAVLVAVLAGGAYAPSRAGVTFTPRAIPVDAPEIPNPLRGQYRWISNPPDPADWPAPDVYYRDEIQWGKRVERQRGTYDFSVFDKGLAEAASRGGMFSFRVMAACPGCGGILAPDYVQRQPGGQPDWNSESFLDGYADLMKALGARYDGDPRLGFVDVGGYGSWGEYHVYDLNGETISRENSKRLVQSVLDAFPNTYVLMMTPNPDYLRDALALSPRVGIRVDCVGDEGMRGSRIDEVPEALQRWKTAPWVGEWCGGSDAPDEYALGLEQVRKYHITSLSSANFPGTTADMSATERKNFELANKTSGYRFVLDGMTFGPVVAGAPLAVVSRWSNVGVGPAYLPWRTQVELRDPRTGAVAVAWPSRVDLSRLLPTGKVPKVVQDSFQVPATLAPGTYDVHVRVVSPRGYPGPLHLAIEGRGADGSYRLGSVQVAPSVVTR